MEQALAYVSCPADDSRAKMQKYCRKIYELGYVPICPQFGFAPFLNESEAEDQQALNRMSHIILRRCRMVVVCGKEVTGRNGYRYPSGKTVFYCRGVGRRGAAAGVPGFLSGRESLLFSF